VDAAHDKSGTGEPSTTAGANSPKVFRPWKGASAAAMKSAPGPLMTLGNAGRGARAADRVVQGPAATGSSPMPPRWPGATAPRPRSSSGASGSSAPGAADMVVAGRAAVALAAPPYLDPLRTFGPAAPIGDQGSLRVTVPSVEI
jgi:hypothetical protein